MVFPVTLKEKGRNRLGLLTAILCAVLALAGLCVICVGLFIQLHITDKLILLESYGSGVIPHFLVSVGAIMFLLNGLTVKFAYDSGFAKTSEKFRLVLVPILIVMFLFIWVILAAGIMTLSMREGIEDAMHGGLRDAMKRYKDNLPVKVTIDSMQMKSRCCGSRSYKDWFEIGWINTDYVNTNDTIVKRKMKDGDIFTDDVPFSCCDARITRPCVTHSVEDKIKHRNYDKVTLYGDGCTDTIMNEFENKIIKPAGSVVMLLFGAQAFVMVLLRYLQTSVQSALEEGNPEGPGRGTLLPPTCKSCTSGNAEKYKEGALKTIRGEKTGGNTTAGDTTADSSMIADGINMLLEDDDAGGGDDDDGGDGGKKKPQVMFDTENSLTPEKQEIEDITANDIIIGNDSFSSLPELDSGVEYLRDNNDESHSISPDTDNLLQDSYIPEANRLTPSASEEFKTVDPLNQQRRITPNSYHQQNRNNEDVDMSDKNNGTDRLSTMYKEKQIQKKLEKNERSNLEYPSQSPQKSKSHEKENILKKSRSKSPKETQSPKKPKSPKATKPSKKSRSKSPKETQSPKKAKSPKATKPSKKSRSKSPKETQSLNKPKSPKATEPSKKSRSKSPKETQSPIKSKSPKATKPSKKSRSKSPKETQSPKKLKSLKATIPSKKSRFKSPKETKSPKKPKSPKATKPSKKSRSKSPKEIQSPKKLKSLKATKPSKKSRSKSPKETQSPKKSKSLKAIKPSKKSRSKSPKETKSPKKLKSLKAPKPSKKSRSKSPKESRSPKKLKSPKETNRSKKSKSRSPKASPKRSKAPKTEKSSKAAKSPSPTRPKRSKMHKSSTSPTKKSFPKMSKSPKKSKSTKRKPTLKKSKSPKSKGLNFVKRSKSPAKSKPSKKKKATKR